MYTVNISVEGIAPLLQNKFPLPKPEDLNKGGKKQSGEKDYSQEWRDHIYVTASGQVYQPSSHFDGCLTKVATNFKVKGQGKKTYKDLFRGNVICTPDEILHGIDAPVDLDYDADKPLYLDMRPVVVQRARIVRVRPALKAGWALSFQIIVSDDEIPVDLLNEALAMAGKTIGIGDFRPKFGRFMVTQFEVQK